jgi:hypothetical protein
MRSAPRKEVSKVRKPPGLEAVNGVLRLKEMLVRGEVKAPIFFILRNHQRSHAGVINSAEDIQVIANKGSPLKIRLPVKKRKLFVTADHEFSIKISRDAEGKAIFLFFPPEISSLSDSDI